MGKGAIGRVKTTKSVPSAPKTTFWGPRKIQLGWLSVENLAELLLEGIRARGRDGKI